MINLKQFAFPDTALADITEVSRNYQSLTLQLSFYVFSNGMQKELPNFKGTIPIRYKNCHYNIPVRIWLMDTHPNNAPLCYVEPTPEMVIQPSSWVDYNGKVYLPYLHDWNPKKSDLISLIQIISMTFSEKPPVYARTTSYSSDQTETFGSYPSTSNVRSPPYPTQGGFSFPNMPSTTQSSTTGTITDQHIRQSLISAIEDKLRRKMREIYSQKEAEVESLKKTKKELTDGREKLNTILRSMNMEKVELERNLKVIEGKSAELDKFIDRLNENADIDVDEAVVATTPLYKQILSTYAEESAIEDTIYYMDEALRRGAIDLETFLKQVRNLSHKQCMLRALLRKCRKEAGLPMI